MAFGNRFAWQIVCFELSLAVVAAAIGRWLGVAPGESLLRLTSFHDFIIATVYGAIAALPMFLGLLAVDRIRWAPFLEMRRFVAENLLPYLGAMSLAELALISASAGFGEELLFRGLIQTGLSGWGVGIAICAASLLFGLFHPVSPAYIVMAFMAGLYLGWLWYVSDQILVPIVAHAVYDFVALVWIVRVRRSEYADSIQSK